MSDPNIKIVRWVVAGVLAVIALAAIFLQQSISTAIQTSTAVQLPQVISDAIGIGIIALLTAGFTWLFNVFGLDLRGTVPVIGLALSTWIVAELQGLVNTIPAQYDPFVSAFFYLLALFLAPAGILFLANRRASPGPARLL